LQIRGEHVFRVPSLEAPSTGDGESKPVLEYSAVQLFIARTRALHSDFTPSDVHLSLIASICERLDGVPLAIEFAAACAATIGLQEIAARLDDRFGLLTAGRRTAPPRQRTLAATLEWSYQLLPVWERRLLRHLAAFRGGFTIDAAIAVASGGGADSLDVVRGIRNLVAKSLVATEGSPVSRWRLLETTREYAGRELEAQGETDESLRRHAQYFRDLTAHAASESSRSGFLSIVVQHSREIDNVRAALDWSFSPVGDTAIGIALAARYAPVWLHLSLLPETKEQVERALASLGPDPEAPQLIRMKLQFALGLALVFTMGLAESIKSTLGFALDTARELGDVQTELQALWPLWILEIGLGEIRTAQLTAERFSRLAVNTGDHGVIAFSNRLLGNTLHLFGRQKDAERHFRAAVDGSLAPVGQQYTTLNFDHRAVSRAGLAATLCLQGFIDQAVDECQESLKDAVATGYLVSTCEVLRLASFPIAVMIGDFAAAERAVTMLVDIATSQNGTYLIILGKFLRASWKSSGASSLRAYRRCAMRSICAPRMAGACDILNSWRRSPKGWRVSVAWAKRVQSSIGRWPGRSAAASSSASPRFFAPRGS
jgi:predicted ATPase